MYGYVLENYLSKKQFIFHYILCGIAGNLLSGYNNPNNISVGASSSLYGIFPLIILYILQNPNM
jgi:rhomboid protease GluP